MTVVTHYVLGIDFEGIEQYILHRKPNFKGPDGTFDYIFEKQEITSGLSAKKPVAYQLIENAQIMLDDLKKPEMQSYLSADVGAMLEFMTVLVSRVPQNSTSMLDYKG